MVWGGELFFQNDIWDCFCITLICQSWDSFMSIASFIYTYAALCCSLRLGALERDRMDARMHVQITSGTGGVVGCSWSGVRGDVPLLDQHGQLRLTCPPCPLLWGGRSLTVPIHSSIDKHRAATWLFSFSVFFFLSPHCFQGIRLNWVESVLIKKEVICQGAFEGVGLGL